MSDHVQTEHHGAVVTIRMARPEKKNALTSAMYDAMDRGLRDAIADDGVRVILLAGADGVFTSGNDLREFATAPASLEESAVIRFLSTLAACPKPVVAAVSGLAIGIGSTMLLHCDLVVADPATRFSLPFINLGLVPEGASSLLLPRLVGTLRASELLLLGDMFDAAAAERYGIINKVSAPGAADAEAMQWAVQLAAKAPTALRLSKALIRSETPGTGARILEEARHFGAQLKGPEFREAVAAFMTKRPPSFSSPPATSPPA
jgi:enoyl-CoA hydratase/carnithine racemase